MRKPTLLHIAIVGASSLATIALWLCFRAPVVNSDAARYERWKHVPALYKRAAWWKKHLPQSLAQAVHLSTLPGRYIYERQRLEAALFASGYLTNVTLAPDTRLTTSRENRIRKARDDAWNISIRREGVLGTCRPQDAIRCKQAFQQ
jgi:hypothetical protein